MPRFRWERKIEKVLGSTAGMIYYSTITKRLAFLCSSKAENFYIAIVVANLETKKYKEEKKIQLSDSPIRQSPPIICTQKNEIDQSSKAMSTTEIMN